MYNLAVSLITTEYKERGLRDAHEFQRDLLYLTDLESCSEAERSEVVDYIKKDSKLLAMYSHDLRQAYGLRVNFRLYLEVVDDKEILQRDVSNVFEQGKDAIAPRMTAAQGCTEKHAISESICDGVDKFWRSRVVIKPEDAPGFAKYHAQYSKQNTRVPTM